MGVVKICDGASKKKDCVIADAEYFMGIEFLIPAKHGASDDLGEGGVGDQEEDNFAVNFSGNDTAPSDIVEVDQHGGDSKDKKANSEDVASKNKKKKKKGGKIQQEEEEDLDKILAEHCAAAPPEEKLQNQPAEQEEAEEEGPVETVTSKKKASAEEEKSEETNTETSSCKKVPKHVREMQARLAKLKKAEERKEREEELQRLAQEKNRLKKEREKEKLLKKKQEGKLLTGKQKKEARRKQILANAKLDIPTGAPSKRPLYQNKKSKAQNQSNGAAISENGESTDTKEILQGVVLELGSVEAENVEDDDDDEEWDAKCWDEADLKLPGKSGFADEEVDSEPEPLPKKDMKDTRTAHASKPIVVDEKVASVIPPKSENVDAEKNSVADDQPVQNGQDLRSPICCIVGHADSGKTKLLDCIRGANVQKGEAGGITQQFGATYLPAENIQERIKELTDAKLDVPGLLLIDTPGHKSFTKLRSTVLGLCDIAVLVVDIMHGLEPQTIESLNLLKKGNTDFLIALNKVDRLNRWKTCRNAPIRKAIMKQSTSVTEFKMRLTKIITQFKEHGINTALYYKSKKMGKTYSIVPTSSISGEGILDLLLLLVKWARKKTMIERLTYREKAECTVLDVKVVEGYVASIDVVLVNGVLHEGDQIVVGSVLGPVVTSIIALLTPHPARELRVKGRYLHHKEIKATQSQCIKIAARGLEHAIAGARLYVCGQ
ncbi:photosystem II [Salvia divinorum]|uniref:Photosystem II n=1 Tax=Salvia divinorum TaxID=28513 RepID=A0ABD1I2U0_SALDI